MDSSMLTLTLVQLSLRAKSQNSIPNKEILKENMQDLIEFEREHWNLICQFEHKSSFSKFRQDRVASDLAMVSFTKKELEAIDMSSHSIHVNVKDIFDKTTVLSTLLIQAHALNDLLQKELNERFGCNIFHTLSFISSTLKICV